MLRQIGIHRIRRQNFKTDPLKCRDYFIIFFFFAKIHGEMDNSKVDVLDSIPKEEMIMETYLDERMLHKNNVRSSQTKHTIGTCLWETNNWEADQQ